MSQGIEKTIFFFKEKGPVNTDRVVDIALDCCEKQGIGKVVVASSTGETALKVRNKAPRSITIICVTYGAGSRFNKEVEAFNKQCEVLLENGIRIVRGLHTLSGAEKSLENKYGGTFTPLNIIADTLRMFSQGIKVCVEIAVMAAEAGFITPDEDVVVMAGSGHGADTAVILKPAYASTIFETRIKQVLCMPA